MLSKEERKELIDSLNKMENPEQILNYLVNTYDLSKPMGSMVKFNFIDGAIKVLNLLNAQKR